VHHLIFAGDLKPGQSISAESNRKKFHLYRSIRQQQRKNGLKNGITKLLLLAARVQHQIRK
jgi:hypothetical protein